MPKGENSGGRIRADGRGPQTPGRGKNAKRHDLERRNTPFLHGSDLQQGDVQALENGQRIAPIRTQQPATSTSTGGTPSSGGATPPAGTMQVPDPIEFAKERFGGQGVGVPSGAPDQRIDISSWLPLAQRMADTPGTSGLLRSAFIKQYANVAKRPYAPDTSVINLQDLDDSVEAMLDGG